MAIGIGISTMWRRGGGSAATDWEAYWASLISATVENAAPTHVVLTFPSAQTSLGASDFTIAGFTISSASWTGAVLTLVLSEAVLVFDGNLTITFVTTGQTATVTNNVADDGASIVFNADNLATITKNESNIVSRVNDELGSGDDLTAGTCEWDADDGFIFNGTDQYLKSGAIAGLIQPTSVYLFFSPISHVTNKKITEGATNATGLFMQLADESAGYAFNAGTQKTGLAGQILIGGWYIVRLQFNGAGSKAQVNKLTVSSGNAGTANMAGITIARYGEAALHFGNFKLKRAIYRKGAADADAVSDAIYKSIKRKYAQDILVIGDSNSEGWNEWPYLFPTIWTGNRKPLVLSRAKASSRIVNIADDEVNNPYMLSQVMAAENDDVEVILVAFGTNDRDGNATIGNTYKTNLELLKTHHPNAAIYCLSVFPNTDENDTVRVTVNEILQAQVTAVSGITWWDTEAWVNRATDFADAYHLDASGHAAVAAEVRSRLDL